MNFAQVFEVRPHEKGLYIATVGAAAAKQTILIGSKADCENATKQYRRDEFAKLRAKNQEAREFAKQFGIL
jgi:hypothetical protein